MCFQRTVNDSEDCLYLGLFSNALASSPFWPKTYRYDDPEAEAIYSKLANLTGCTPTADTDSLSCLKSVDVQSIRDASLTITTSNQWTTSSYIWAPVIDGSFLVDTLSHAVSHSSLLPTHSIFSTYNYNTHNDQPFLPPHLSLTQSDNQFNTAFSSWLEGFLPDLTPGDIHRIEIKYISHPPTFASK